ncbi:toll/interleukin-1 receptor domain-containing protein [Turneriella parva]|uniref:TIR domain-containing protein n=1 Tax=Turneriella parva (strain ATCC BAA-1111 / DSM 21527 / NCTC 11395 / H) TaxID=869212 RepID=I4BA89_TURPD|nr:toll/interleukin-1 receptor domain-containing protein [Turneriella parva]AFM14196.1 hypothetical protein Turpa_3561 [Turneriella parva DSM 21527]
MGIFKASELRSLAENSTLLKSRVNKSQAAGQILFAEAKNAVKPADIFLSHSSLDATYIYGLKLKFESYGYGVYIDWIDDAQLDRRNVTLATANTIKERMRSAKCLFFAVSSNASNSKWMPWELGFMDGLRGRAAICPIELSNMTSNDFKGQEYLGVYPYITEEGIKDQNRKTLWVNRNPKTYVRFSEWLQGNSV